MIFCHLGKFRLTNDTDTKRKTCKVKKQEKPIQGNIIICKSKRYTNMYTQSSC